MVPCSVQGALPRFPYFLQARWCESRESRPSRHRPPKLHVFQGKDLSQWPRFPVLGPSQRCLIFGASKATNNGLYVRILCFAYFNRNCTRTGADAPLRLMSKRRRRRTREEWKNAVINGHGVCRKFGQTAKHLARCSLPPPHLSPFHPWNQHDIVRVVPARWAVITSCRVMWSKSVGRLCELRHRVIHNHNQWNSMSSPDSH